ncbi:MAG: helix-turn-helix domain-containing protein [Flavobacteriia bacterium]|nr:helix-turn-helix domain-containing protein [Flavobacteriia bacterium]
MEIIVFEKESFYKLIDELTVRIIRNTEKHFNKEEWVDETEAKLLLGIKSKSKLQQLRDNIKIEFSQFGKIIRYSRSSILRFLEQNRVGLDRF